MIIRGLTPGNMVGGSSRQRYKSEYGECPECGGGMRKGARRCHECHVKQAETVGSVAQDRRERFDLALAAGWTLEDIYGYDPDEPYDPNRDKLPTMEEIVARLIKQWWVHVL